MPIKGNTMLTRFVYKLPGGHSIIYPSCRVVHAGIKKNSSDTQQRSQTVDQSFRLIFIPKSQGKCPLIPFLRHICWLITPQHYFNTTSTKFKKYLVFGFPRTTYVKQKLPQKTKHPVNFHLLIPVQRGLLIFSCFLLLLILFLFTSDGQRGQSHCVHASNVAFFNFFN